MKKHNDSLLILLLGIVLLLPFWAGCEPKDDRSSSEVKVRDVEPSQQLSQQRYSDPKGFFNIVPPAGWHMQDYPEDPRGKVAFICPEADVSLRVLTNVVDFSTFEELLEEIKSIGERYGMEADIERITFSDHPAIKRKLLFKGLRLFLVDFLEGKVAHNIQYAAPPDKYEKYLPVVMKSIETYEPIVKEVTGEDNIKSIVAKKLRLAQLMIELGNLDLAFELVKEGLEVSPQNPDLIKLKKQIEDTQKTRE